MDLFWFLPIRINVSGQFYFFDYSYRDTTRVIVVKNGQHVDVYYDHNKYSDRKSIWILNIDHLIKHKIFIFGYGISGVLGVRSRDTESFQVKIRAIPFGINFWRLVTIIYFEGQAYDLSFDVPAVGSGLGLQVSYPIRLFSRIRK